MDGRTNGLETKLPLQFLILRGLENHFITETPTCYFRVGKNVQMV